MSATDLALIMTGPALLFIAGVATIAIAKRLR